MRGLGLNQKVHRYRQWGQMIDQFAAFEQRPDNKLWLFYRISGALRLAKVYVFAYTWHEGRSGALAALHVALDEVEGKEVEKPQECLVEAGSMVVYVNHRGFRMLETTVPMSGEDVRGMAKGDGELLDSIRERMSGLKSNGLACTEEALVVDDVESAVPAVSDEPSTDEPSEETIHTVYVSDHAIALLLWCPGCNERHIDEGEFATKLHHTHACQHCGMVWRPAIEPTVGVLFLPGFKNEIQSE